MEYRVLRLSAVTPAALREWFSEADEETQAGLLRLRLPQAQKQSLAADHLARKMLKDRCGAAEIVFRRGENGKPFVELPICFNLSHSGDFAACAVHERPVGVDIEVLREIPARTARRVCTARELDSLYEGGAFDSARFLQVWTAKEAYLKYLGCGLRKAPREVEVVGEDGALRVCGCKLFTCRTDAYALSVVYE